MALRIVELRRAVVIVINATLDLAWLLLLIWKGLVKARLIESLKCCDSLLPLLHELLLQLPRRGQAQPLRDHRCLRLQLCHHHCTRLGPCSIGDHLLQVRTRNRTCMSFVGDTNAA